MSRTKNDKADLRARYPMLAELGLISSLLLLITAFQIDYNEKESFEILNNSHPVIDAIDVIQTVIPKPPPPPRPQIPVEVPDDTPLEVENIHIDHEIDETRSLHLPPPPKPVEEEEIFDLWILEVKPELIGGLEAIQRNIVYPNMAVKAGIEGLVILKFVVDEKGNVIDPEVVRGIGGGCDEEALRAIRSARFTPGMQRGRPVKVKYSVPIRFRLR